MEPVQYVNKVGKLINDSTKTNIVLDRTSIKNLILYNHLIEVYDYAMKVRLPVDVIEKLKAEIHCLKKQINFYPDKVVDEDCILTETENHIIQE